MARTPRALEQQSAEALKVLAVHDGAFFEETYNLLNAWLASSRATPRTTSAGWRSSRRTWRT